MAGAGPALAQGDHGFKFVRVQFGDEGIGYGRGAEWAHDYPTAELNFYEALERTTKIQVERPSVILELDDDQIFDYPLLYLCEPGYWLVEDDEAANLRKYLDRGGFILFDDFRGEDEWNQLMIQLDRVFPGKRPVEVPRDHSIWQIYYEVDPVEAPSLVSGRGRGGRRGGFRGRGGGQSYDTTSDRYFTMFDDNGRMMMLIAYNQDLGDGWELPGFNDQNASTMTFMMGVNFLMYALTH